MKVKICGLKTKEAVDTAVQAGADYLGFVFAESKRQVSPELVKAITADVPEQVSKVGVFVAPTVAKVEETIIAAGLDLVQLHGQLPAVTFSVPHTLAVSVQPDLTIPLEVQQRADYLLFDAPPKVYVGGNGEVFDWEQLNIAEFDGNKIFIAGGLTSNNVQQVKDYFQPYGVDVSSGVETNGVKDCQKIRRFIQKAKGDFYV